MSFFRKKRSGSRCYLQLVENRWEEGRTKQRVLVTLGRVEELERTGQLDRLLASGARFSKKLMILSAHENGELSSARTRRLGAALVFERLWRESGCQEVLEELLAERQFEFPFERMIFLRSPPSALRPGLGSLLLPVEQ